MKVILLCVARSKRKLARIVISDCLPYLRARGNMYRTLFFFTVLLLAVNPVSAYASTLTNAELKQLTSHMFFSAGHSIRFGVSYHATWYPNGTREVYWTDGKARRIVKGKWRLNGDNLCFENEDMYEEECDQWRKNGDRIERWGYGTKHGYFYILP